MGEVRFAQIKRPLDARPRSDSPFATGSAFAFRDQNRFCFVVNLTTFSGGPLWVHQISPLAPVKEGGAVMEARQAQDLENAREPQAIAVMIGQLAVGGGSEK